MKRWIWRLTSRCRRNHRRSGLRRRGSNQTRSSYNPSGKRWVITRCCSENLMLSLKRGGSLSQRSKCLRSLVPQGSSGVINAANRPLRLLLIKRLCERVSALTEFRNLSSLRHLRNLRLSVWFPVLLHVDIAKILHVLDGCLRSHISKVDRTNIDSPRFGCVNHRLSFQLLHRNCLGVLALLSRWRSGES